jgi:rubrerythrin
LDAAECARREGRRVAADEPSVLELLIEHELAVKRLYEAFALDFGDRRDLWQSLARDEQGHADRLERLRPRSTEVGRLWLDSGLRPQAIKSSIAYVESQRVRAEEGGLRLLQALAIAKDLENALIEKEFSKLSGPTNVEIRSVLDDLAAETEKHRRVLAEALEAESRSRL